jgi:thiol-disulfide isomerase/thioredoxin
MQKISSTLTFFFCLFLMSQANAQITREKGYLINGTIIGIDTGVVRMVSNNLDVIDSAIIVKGKFVMRGKIGLPDRRSFLIAPGNWAFRGFVEDTVISFGIDTSDAMHQYSGKKDYPMIWQIKETGSKLSDIYTKYQNETGQTYYLSLVKKLKTAHPDSIVNIKNKIDSIHELLIVTAKKWLESYIQQYPASTAGIYIFNDFCNTLPDISPTYLQSVLNQFSGLAKSSTYYEALNKKLANLENKQVNNLAPDFTLLKKDKTRFTLSATRGAFTMIDFWASWCVPCRKGIPNWKKVYAKYHQKGFNIISVSDDRNWDNWIRALDKEKMPWLQVVDEYHSKSSAGRVGELYGVRFLPFFVLLDKEGKVILASGDEGVMTKKIEEVLQ